MMSRGVADDEVINKLWQVYSESLIMYPRCRPWNQYFRARCGTLFRLTGTSKEIPRFQRRGSIITLGMFAQPRPEVVADHVDTLLKIGLGSLGRVSGIVRSLSQMPEVR